MTPDQAPISLLEHMRQRAAPPPAEPALMGDECTCLSCRSDCAGIVPCMKEAPRAAHP